MHVTSTRSNPLSREVRGASIEDTELGVVYEATVGKADGRVWLESLTILPQSPGQRIDKALLSRVPAQRIAEQVALHLAAEDADREQYGPRFLGTYGDGERQTPHDPPTVDQVAALVKAGENRHTIATRYGVTKWAADVWIRKARQAGKIPAARADQQPADKPARPNRGRAQKPNKGTENSK